MFLRTTATTTKLFDHLIQLPVFVGDLCEDQNSLDYAGSLPQTMTRAGAVAPANQNGKAVEVSET